jgi:hypothetical protein
MLTFAGCDSQTVVWEYVVIMRMFSGTCMKNIFFCINILSNICEKCMGGAASAAAALF